MSLRILVDENTSPRLVAHLRKAGHEASHVLDTLGDGASDGRIVSYAEERGYAVLTHDDDFLVPERWERARILYYPETRSVRKRSRDRSSN